MVPTPVLLRDRLRVYFTTCDGQGVGRPSFVDLDLHDPKKIMDIHDVPLLEVGLPGTFDENGVLTTSVISIGPGQYMMYFVGFELGTKIRYRLLSGAAVSDDGGMTFRRVRRTPILERSDSELYFRGGPFVLYDGQSFSMWYVAGSEWTDVGAKTAPVYDLRYIESKNGIDWPAQGQPCLQLVDEDEHGFGRPWVVRGSGMWELFFSIRKRSLGNYRMGYATSADGKTWMRNDSAMGLDVSPGGFDSDAIMYAAVIKVSGATYCFYNGNEFGKLGFGVAVLE